MPRGIHYFAKSELFGKWYSRFLIETLNTIPVQRGVFDRNSLEKGIAVLKRGEWLLVFPEGTRSRDGRLKRGKSGAAKLSLEAGVPVIPACIRNSNRILRTIFSTDRVVLRFGKPIYPAQYERIEIAKERLSCFTDEIMRRIGMLMEQED
jgi:1-acyl-sn-glycerol-3-phosphate acyltransferase